MHVHTVYGSNISTLLIPLTTNDDYSHHRNSATHYQLLQSVLKIGSALAERGGGWVGVTLWVTVHSSCQCQVGHSISGIVGSFQSRGAFSGRRARSIKCWVMTGCGQGHKLAKNI